MGNDHRRGAHAADLVLEPFDGGEIEMVRRLVEKQHVRLWREHPRQRRAAGFAAGQDVRPGIAINVQPVEQGGRAVRVVTGREGRRDKIRNGPMFAEIRKLRQVPDRCLRVPENLAVLWFHQARRDLEQGRFAGPVASDKRDSLSRP